MLGMDLVDKGTQPGCVKFARQGTPPSPQGEEGHWLYGVCCGVSLLCQPALHFTPLSHNWGKGPTGFFSPTSPSLCFAFTDARFLSYNFTIDPRPRDDQPWCEVQGEIDQKVFLSYDCGTAKIKYLSPLGEEVKSMSTWETQTDTLKDTGDLLKGQMPDVTPEKHTDRGELENPNAGGVDWGLSCIHCFRVKKKKGYCPSLVV